jgi:hypothetical protein
VSPGHRYEDPAKFTTKHQHQSLTGDRSCTMTAWRPVQGRHLVSTRARWQRCGVPGAGRRGRP